MRDFADSDSDFDEYDQVDRDLILRQVSADVIVGL